MLLLWMICMLCPPSTFSSLPIAITTWSADGFQKATAKAFSSLPLGRLYALVEGLSTCEQLQCDTTVGFGGSPAEDGTVALDALLIDSPAHRVGSVASMRRIRDAARVAWAVMNYTRHTLLVGEAATAFALEMGFKEEKTETVTSFNMTEKWKQQRCQPNFRQNVFPNPMKSCGPYRPIKQNYEDAENDEWRNRVDRFNHDTIGMVVVDEKGDVSAGTSTNGASHKIPGRVGDSPITGSGAFALHGVGGAAATGDGDVMMRFLPSYQTVEWMRQGVHPAKAAARSLQPILKFYRSFVGAVVAVTVDGRYGAACAGMTDFSFSLQRNGDPSVRVESVTCIKP